MSSAHGRVLRAVPARLTDPKACRFLQTGAVALAGALLLALLVSYAALLHAGDAGIKQTDFMAYYSGARLVVEGHGGSLYNFATLGHLERQLVYPLHVRNAVLPFVYPPYVALAVAALAGLPYAAAYFLWLTLNCLLLAAVLYALQRYLPLATRGRILLWLGTFSFLPVFVALAQGQTSVLLLGLIAAGLFALRSNHDALAGVCLALALVKPPYVAPFVLVLLLHRRFRALGALAATAGILAVVPMAILGPATDLEYLHTLIRASAWHAQFGYGALWNHSLAGFFRLLFPPAVAGTLTLFLDLVAVAALAYAAWHCPDIDRPYGLAVVVALLIGPHVLIHDLCLALLAAGVMMRLRDQEPRKVAPLLVACYVLLLIGLRLVSAIHVQISVLALVALAVWLFLGSMREQSLAEMHSQWVA